MELATYVHALDGIWFKEVAVWTLWPSIFSIFSHRMSLLAILSPSTYRPLVEGVLFELVYVFRTMVH